MREINHLHRRKPERPPLHRRRPNHHHNHNHLSPLPRPRSFKTLKTLKRSSSEPSLQTGCWNSNTTSDSCNGGLLYKPPSCTDTAFLSSPSLLIPSSPSQSHLDQGYRMEDKVVVNITVEGSPGPIKTLVKLGSSVADTINLVLHKYNEEGRTPKLQSHSASSFDLHLSNFTLQSIEKTELMGDIGSRTFYLRRRRNSSSSGSLSPPPPIPPPPFLVSTFVSRKFSKYFRRMRKLFRIAICL